MSRPVVVIQSGDAFENRARVLPVAVAALAHGWDPVVLVDDIGAASLFLAHGAGAVAVGALEAAPAPSTFDDVDPDELAPLALASREAAGKTLSAAEWADILARSRTLWRLLDDLAPSALFVWNGHTGVWANALRVYKARRGLPGGFMERGPIADAVFVDPEGVNGDASCATGEADGEEGGGADAGEAPAAPRGLVGRFLARLAPAAPPPLSNGRERVVFVPLQVGDDSNILLHSPRIRRMRDLVLFALALSRALGPGWRVVVRPHPEERAGARPNLPVDPLLAVDGETPLDAWLGRAAVCLTVNSNVGLSAALAGGVVVTLGEGIYCREPFVAARQDCDLGRAVADVHRRLDGPSPASGAQGFMERLAETALFRLGDDPALAAARLERCGLIRHEGVPANVPAGAARAPVVRAGPAFAGAMGRLAALKAGAGEIAVDFDFEPGETLFLTYRRNREELTREFLADKAEAALGRPVRLSPTHRALGRKARVLLTNSRRMPEDAGDYELVLDEFGLPHARLHLAD